MNSIIKRAAIPRSGYEYQDLVGIEILINHFRDPNLYEWVQIESDDGSCTALDDVVTLRKDGSIELFQVKFTVNPERYFLDWDWLLETRGKGNTMLSKWVESFFRAKLQGPVHQARLVTNRVPSDSFKENLDGIFVNIDKVADDIRGRVEIACGGMACAREFFREFEFLGEQPDLDSYEGDLRDKLVPSDTSLHGWLLLQKFVRRCAIQKNHPNPDGKIYRDHLVQIITKQCPQPISQEFSVPKGYQVPSRCFNNKVRARIKRLETPITVLWAPPGLGKSTYLSYLVQSLQREGEFVLRHHYFLSSDTPRADRMSYADISASIVDQVTKRYPDVASLATTDEEDLHTYLGDIAATLDGEGRRLFLVIDGLDHVWRDTSRVDQLNHLFNTLFPLPANISLLIGTQRVPDAQLPVRLLENAKETDWIKLPSMDEFAVHKWLKSQDEERSIALLVRGIQERECELTNISSAFFRVSQGHPLYLIYALRELMSKGKEISTYEIEALPLCPDGDIRSYYDVLWTRLPATARDILHAIAGSEFFWPSQGIQECFGNFSDINFLLESRSAGMVPFHPSIFAYVRDRPDHSDAYAALLPDIIDWLEKRAPEYWRWGWLWLAQVKMGNNTVPLLEGVCRDWVVSSLVQGWPERQIARILSAAETIAFEQGDIPKTVRLRSLKNQVLDVREFQSGDYGQFRATALAIGDNHQQMLILIDDIQDLSADEIVSIVKSGPIAMRKETAQAGLEELTRRINAWTGLRQSHEEFWELSGCLISTAAFAGASAVPRTLRHLQGFQDPASCYNEYIELLGASRDIEALRAVRRSMCGRECIPQRRLIQEHILRVALFEGENPIPLIRAVATDLTPFTASWLVRSGVATSIRFYALPPPENILSERYPFEGDSDMPRYFCDFFWSAFCISLQAKGNFSLLYPSRDEGRLGWLVSALRCLEDVARGIATGRYRAVYSTIYVAADALESQDHVGLNNRDGAQFQVFKNCLSDIAMDIYLLGLADQHQPQITMEEFDIARQTRHWDDEMWIARNMKNYFPLLDESAANAFIQERSSAISNKVSTFKERSEQWTQLASLASVYGVQNPTALLRRAADCLTGYGCSKDQGAGDTLGAIDAIRQVHAIDARRAEELLSAVMPIIDQIRNFTDDSDTDDVHSEFMNTVAAIMPRCLASFYARYISQEDFYYADKTLEVVLRTIDLSSKSAAGLCSTLLDDKMLQILEERSRDEPIAASLLQKQIDFLARSQPVVGAGEQYNETMSHEQKTALQQDPTTISPNNFGELVELVSASNFPYQYHVKFFRKWLDHWRLQGKVSIALDSVQGFFDTDERCLIADNILDHAFEVSLAEQGREAAYPWLVKAHIYRCGWRTLGVSEEEVMTRLTHAARLYPKKWQDFIRDTSEQPLHLRRFDLNLSIGCKYLVRFLLFVGQADIALSVTDEFVKTLVSEVGDQPIPEASWLCDSSDADLACELLFERLNWPVPFVRWRAARAIRDLLNDALTRRCAISLLLRNLERCTTESATCSLLIIILLTDPDNRPTHTEITERLRNPSILSDILLQQIYATEPDLQAWRSFHSGWAPDDFELDVYFYRHKNPHAPPILFHNIQHLEAQTGMPFLRQWAFEWKHLCDRISMRFERYPHYFGGASDMHTGIIGQYLQCQNEVYRSAYSRVLATAVDQWGMSANDAMRYCLDNMPIIPGVFEIDPGRRPAWLEEIPERALAIDFDLKDILHELVEVSRTDTQTMVSLHTPFRKDMQLYGHLSVTALFVADDFQLGDDDFYKPRTTIPLFDRLDPRGSQMIMLDEPVQKGSKGHAIPVCATWVPCPIGSGHWMGDYFSVGLSVPASYCLPEDTILRCSVSGLEFVSAGSTVAFTRVWHDNWSPRHPRDGHTRCGVVAFIDASELAKAQTEVGYHLGWLIERYVWKREGDYGEFKPSKHRAIVVAP